MDSAGGNGDQRVTNAIVKRDLDDLRQMVSELVREMREHNRTSEQRFQLLEKADAVQDKDIEQLSEDVKSLKSKDTAGTIGSLLVGLFASLVAIFRP